MRASSAAWLVLTTAVVHAQVPGRVLVIPDTPVSSSAPAADAPVPLNVEVTATLLRHRPTSGTVVAAGRLEACRTLGDTRQTLLASGRVESLYHARRLAVCEPAARLEFNSTESRPAFTVTAAGQSFTNQTYGVLLRTDVRVIAPPDFGRPAFVGLEWEGSWSGSVSLLSEWEQLAVRGFNLAAKIPNITYEKVEEDEDGFVNTGGGVDVGGFFRRKKKDRKEPAKKPAVVLGAKPAAAGSAAAANEPSYLADHAFESAPFKGQWLGPGNALLILRHPLPGGADAGDLYLVLEVETEAR